MDAAGCRRTGADPHDGCDAQGRRRSRSREEEGIKEPDTYADKSGGGESLRKAQPVALDWIETNSLPLELEPEHEAGPAQSQMENGIERGDDRRWNQLETVWSDQIADKQELGTGEEEVAKTEE